MLDRTIISCCNTAVEITKRVKWCQHLTLNMPMVAQHAVWIHACSVGEVNSVAPLVRALLGRHIPVHLTVVTLTGMKQATRLFGDQVSFSWLAWDLPGLMSRMIRHLHPRLLLLTETEFWPGMLRACQKQHIPVVGVNTRISDRSFPRYRATSILWKYWLSDVQVFLAQSEQDARRLADIGVDVARIRTVGNLKYAIDAPSVDAETIRHQLDHTMQRPILLAASTHEGEDALLLEMWPAWKRLQPDLLMIIAPRHPERFGSVATLLDQAGVNHARWTSHETAGADIILLDTMGMMNQLYAIADLAFIGGSLVSTGGHNPLEAAICGRGVITGPHIYNFQEMMRDMQHAGAAVLAKDASDMDQTVQRFLKHPDELRTLHAHASLFMQGKSKVLPRVLENIEPYL